MKFGIRPTLKLPPAKTESPIFWTGYSITVLLAVDRIAFHKALDDIAASETGGHFFSLRVLKEHFPRGVQLLAANELTPRLPSDALEIIRKGAADFTAGQMISPAYRAQRALKKATADKRSRAARSNASDHFKRHPR